MILTEDDMTEDADEAKRKAFAVLRKKIAELEAILEKGPPKPPTEKPPVTNGN